MKLTLNSVAWIIYAYFFLALIAVHFRATDAQMNICPIKSLSHRTSNLHHINIWLEHPNARRRSRDCGEKMAQFDKPGLVANSPFASTQYTMMPPNGQQPSAYFHVDAVFSGFLHFRSSLIGRRSARK